MAGLNIGFMSNQLDERGTGNALYNYAHYNEEILGNTSYVLTYGSGQHDEGAKRRFLDRFGGFKVIYLPYHQKELDALYHIKSGYDDGFRPENDIPYFVHSVFDNEPHGTVYATISPWMATRFNLPYVPHIVEVADTTENYRDRLNIPENAVVFGRYGGSDSFDIPFVKSAIYHYLKSHDNVYFIFMNTDVFVEHSRVTYFPATVDPRSKRMFINTCDAMIHARSRGETFGIAVGEFAICGKPVITYAGSHERAHIEELGHFGLWYDNVTTLNRQFDKVLQGPMISWGYGQYTPELVMRKFDEVFLNGAATI